MHERFKRLCEIESITENERAVQDAIAAELRGMGYEVSEDDAAGPARAGAGNLTCRDARPRARRSRTKARGRCSRPTSTPSRTTSRSRSCSRDGVFLSAGDTILGADNKAAVTVLMEMAAIWADGEGPPAGVELLFTVAEEQGLRGAHAYDVSTLKADTGFVLDHATPIGEIITAAPTYKKLIADFTGVESHAGLFPEKGAQRDRGRLGRDRGDGAGPPRRGDDGQRRPDRGRQRSQRRRRLLPGDGGGAGDRDRARAGGAR